ncbi:PREDICTED: uncharacterized protein LOC108800344, partial [Nanorana parkeri]|uniref:uncharacterized protein LOC108800344 n=1 Tax=Nanorana parkeri TaxID=125878 RepID=UPI00085434CF
MHTAKSSVPAKNQGFKSLLLRISCIWPLKYVFAILKKIASFAGFTGEVETVGIADQMSPRRRFLSGRKRIGRLARLILFITPYRLQCALGYHSADSIGKTEGCDEIRKSPLKPSGKGNKRKQDDLEVEEEYHSWVTFMTEDLPEEDQDDDPTYEPSKSETDSEENRSKNDTESDLEVEEKDGVLMLKESSQDTPVNEQARDTPVNEEQAQEGENNEEQKTSSA